MKKLKKVVYLVTEWEAGNEKLKYLTLGPCVLTESQIFSRPARPDSFNKLFII